MTFSTDKGPQIIAGNSTKRSPLKHEDLADAVLKRMGDLEDPDRTAAAAVVIAVLLERVIADAIEACKDGGILALCDHAYRVTGASMDLREED